MDSSVHLVSNPITLFRNCVNVTKWCLVDPIDEYHLHRPAKDLLSNAHVGLVRRWMSTCEAEHKKCLQNSYSGSAKNLPTRVLKIEGKDNEVMTVKLFETGDQQTGVYACLSYCWGSNLQLSMTTTTNLNEYRHAIPWKELPSTIIDAIKLCYRLGFEYIWVDSLCIVQDDPEDWMREASIMGGIYSRSALTLAIHLCDDASESFLQKRFWNAEQRSDALHKYGRIPFTDHRTGDKCDMFLWNHNSVAGPRFLERWWHSVQDVERNKSLGKWSSRAWTIQEWLLSPRVLHFNSMTLWDCLESHGNELEKRFLSKTSARWDFQVYFWEFIVRDFTSRQITKEKDRLPALAGLAERFQADSGGVYLAGLWLEALPKSLVWIRSNQRHPMNSPTAYRAPTWSWAALEGEVDYPRDLRVMISTSEIIGFHCQYDPPDKFTTVTDGWLDIEGPISVVSGWTLGDGEDSWLSEVRLLTHDQPADILTAQCWVAILDRGKSLEEVIRRRKVYLLQIMYDWRADHSDPLRIYVLVLQVARQPGIGKECFRRLGIAYLNLNPSSSTPRPVWATRTIRII